MSILGGLKPPFDWENRKIFCQSDGLKHTLNEPEICRILNAIEPLEQRVKEIESAAIASAEIAKLKAENEKMRGFFRDLVKDFANGGEMNCDDFADFGVKHGLLEWNDFDSSNPEHVQIRDEGNFECEDGDRFWSVTIALDGAQEREV